jgi:hypothetical protein
MEADMTRVALIPPLTRVGDINKYGRGVQLVLPHLWNASVRYRDAYVQAASNGDLMIVDNGAFEGEVRDISVCMELARHFIWAGTKEIEVVLPDVMKDWYKTKMAVEAVASHLDPNFKYMYVVQGGNLDEVWKSARHAANLPFVKTLGIPKHLVTTTMDPLARSKAMRMIHEAYPNLEIHFLGMPPRNRNEIKLHDVQAVVRSMDTSMPYVYAMAGQKIFSSPVVMERREEYFRCMEDYDPQDNIEHLLAWSD